MSSMYLKYFFLIYCKILNRYDKNKGVKKIDEQIREPIQLSPDCNKVAYSKLNGKSIDNLTTSDLYIYETGKKSIKILENCFPQYQYNFSWETNGVAYTEVDGETNTFKLYIKNQFKDKELVDEGTAIFPLSYSDNGNILAYEKKDSNLEKSYYYIKKANEKPEHIATSNYFQLMPGNFSAYYIEDDIKAKQIGNLYYKELNKKPVKIATEVKKIISGESIYGYINSLKQKGILFQKNDGAVFLINEKKAPQKMCNLNTDESILLDESAKGFTIVPEREGIIKRGIYDKAKKNYVIK
ncbi:MAG: hypothetical protein H7Y18_08395, partial [Clostridiaceae bacterium]|nr:hypothetical protein [Clostridiaceae bacterium]